MWRIATRPLETTSYSEREQTDAAAQQYTDTLSPPLLLMLTLLIAHGLGLGLGARTAETDSAIGKTIFGSAQNLLMLRALAFSIFPLTAATTLLRRRHLAIDRTTLRGPFFSQCYLTAPFALAVSIGNGADAHAGLPAPSPPTGNRSGRPAPGTTRPAAAAGSRPSRCRSSLRCCLPWA